KRRQTEINEQPPIPGVGFYLALSPSPRFHAFEHRNSRPGEMEMNALKSCCVLMVLVLPALAQDKPAPLPAACGPLESKFDVHRDETQHAITPPEPGKARIYFIQDLGVVNCINGCFTVRTGVDGTWIGATKENSYFSVSVEPGEHHLCVSAQSKLLERQF